MKIREGDVFIIPLSATTYGVGQIVKLIDKYHFIVILYDIFIDNKNNVDFKKLNETEIIFFGLTMDSLFYHKRWNIIGNYLNSLKGIEMPIFKLGTPPTDIFIVDCFDEIIRECTLDEFNILEYKTIIAPIRFEKALKANFGIAEWDSAYNKIKYEYIKEINKLILI